MIINNRIKQRDERNRLEGMHYMPWFAWYPVPLYRRGEYMVAWLEVIERKRNTFEEWVYKEVEKL